MKDVSISEQSKMQEPQIASMLRCTYIFYLLSPLVSDRAELHAPVPTADTPHQVEGTWRPYHRP